jgi:hypothetical protein
MLHATRRRAARTTISGSLRVRSILGRIVPLLIGVLILPACLQLPTSGTDVLQGQPSGETEGQANVAVVAAPPRDGDTPAQVVEGFVAAMASFEPGYRTAREYLTPEASQQWSPADGIAVYDLAAGPRTVVSSRRVVRTELPLFGEVSGEGSFTRAPSGARLRLESRMARVEGQWRIATPPTGLVMSAFDFEREFQAYDIAFLNPSRETVVADPVYLPVRADTPTLLVDALLAGPTSRLRPAVVTAVPSGVVRASGQVPVVAGVAEVNLYGPGESGDELASLEPDQAVAMAAQLAWTLRQVPGLSGVRVLQNGQPVTIPGRDSDIVSVSNYSSYDPSILPTDDTVFAVTDEGVIAADISRVESVAGPLGQRSDLRSVAVDYVGTQAAAVTRSGRELLVAPLSEGEARLVLRGADLGQPSWSRDGTLWVSDNTPGGVAVVSIDATTGAQQVSEIPDADGPARGVYVSPDGVRVVALLGRPGRATVQLGLVLRSADGHGLGRWQVAQQSFARLEALSWSSPTGLAVLASVEPDEPIQTYQLDLDLLEPVPRGQVSGAVELAAAPGRPLVVSTSDGELLRQDAPLEWSPVTQAAAPSYPG